MARQDLQEQLTAYPAYSDEEEGFRLRMLQLIAEEPDCFHRHLQKGHFTGSAFIISPTKDKVLLLHHRKLDKWLQPGGHADGDENIARVAEKEAREETGITSIRLLSPAIFDLDIHPIPARKEEPAHEHFDIRYLFVANPEEPLQPNKESKGLAWLSLDAAAEKSNFNQSICRMIEKISQL